MFSNEKENMSARIEIYLQLNEKMIGQTNSQFGQKETYFDNI